MTSKLTSLDIASNKVERQILLKRHYAFQLGCFVSATEERRHGISAFSDFTAVPMWNHSAWIGGSSDSFQEFVKSSEAWHNERNRPGVLYVVEPNAAERAVLAAGGYDPFDEEAWMVLASSSGAFSKRVTKAESAQEIEEFANVFSVAFSVKQPGYKAALLSAPQTRHKHYVLRANGRAVAGATLAADGSFACVYNVATIPSARQKGFGSEVVQHLIAEARNLGCETIFLQVENNGAPKRLYEKLGFRTAFVRSGYRQRNWVADRKERTLLATLFPYPAGIEQVLIGRESRPIPATLLTELKKAFPHTTAENLFIGAWAYLLHRYTGQNALPFRLVNEAQSTEIEIAIDSTRTVAEWVGAAKKHSIASGEAETALIFGERSSGTPRPGLPLEVHVEDFQRLQIVYRGDLFTKDSVRRIASHYLTLLESISRAPNASLKDLEILPESEKQQLLVTWNQLAFTPTVTNVVRTFEEQVERSPEAVALVMANAEGEQLSYRQLNRRANRLAHRLQDLGIGPEAAVAILLDRSPEMLIALLAVFKAGGVCVPIDPGSPPERVNFVLQDIEARVVLTKRSVLRTSARHATVLYLDEPIESLHTKDKNPINRSAPEHAAYIIYTSGSTGNPKGVVIPHHAFANHCLDCRSTYGLSSRDRVLQFSAFHFDAAFEQIFPTLLAGATVVVRDDTVWTAAQFGEKLREQQLTVADVPTAYWHELADYWSQDPGQRLSHSLRLVIVGGEALSPDKLHKWRQTPFAEVRLLNAYGPTETTITAASCEIPQNIGSVNLPIGRPRGDRKSYVLDDLGRPVPIGLPGELHIGGSMLARGYHKQPKLTDARFIPNPFSDDPAARLYKTGDLVRYLEDGTLEFLGRIDDQVKVRGYRIELGEIETHLRRHPAVRECLVLARTGSRGEKQLVAYALTRTAVSSAALRNHLRGSLPEYMMPAHILLLEQWPLLANGKINRSALPEPGHEMPETGAFSGPRNPLELQVQLLFERVLKRGAVGIDQSFFELGGDSLQALDLLIQIEKETGKQLPLGTLYQASTIESLARELSNGLAPEAWSSLVPLQARGRRAPFYLLHTTPGDILGYGNLVYRLGPDQPCYGFQSLGLKDAHLSHTSIEEMARYYVDLLRRFQPHGPYFLGGWCYGGVLAVEMARVLKAQGETIGLLALLETVAMPAKASNIRYYAHRARCFFRMSPAKWVVYAREKIRYRRNARLANRMRFRQVETPQSEPDPRLLQLEHVYNTNLAALNRYRTRYYDGTVTLFNAAERDPAVIPDEQYGWVGLAREIEINEVPGNHDTMLTEPNVSILAERLNQLLRVAQEKRSSP